MTYSNRLRVSGRELRNSIAYLCVVILMHSACQAEQPTLDKALSALESWRASFDSIQITYEIDEGVRENLSSTPMISVGEYYWSEAKRFYWYERLLEDGKQLRHHLDWGDGITSGRAIYPKGEGTEQAPPTMIDYGRIEADGYNGVQGRVITPIDGLWQSQTCQWLPAVLREQQAKTRVISTDGAECLEVTYQKAGDRGSTTIVLDPRYSYLARRVLTGWDYTVSEFKRFPPGIWMPTLGTLDVREREQAWKITSVVFNEDIADEKVRMPAPGDGTRITDITQRKSWFHGSPPPITETSDQDESFPMLGTGGPVVAKPHTGIGNSLPVWIAIAAFATVAFLSLIRITRKD